MTKLVSCQYADAINTSSDSFLANIKQNMSHYKSEEILNADQISLELETRSTSEHVNLARVRSKKRRNASLHYPTDDISCWSTCWSCLSWLERAKEKNE